MTFQCHLKAAKELTSSIQYYEEKSIGLGAEFLDQIEKAIAQAIAPPQYGSLLTKQDLRTHLMRNIVIIPLMSNISRYKFITMMGASAAAFVCAPRQTLSINTIKQYNKMYGLIGKMTAKDGQRDELIGILIKGSAKMPGCLSYIVSEDSEDEDVIWVTEVWENKESHKKSLKLPAVQEAMKQGRPLISEFNEHIEMEPVGGHGLVSTEN